MREIKSNRYLIKQAIYGKDLPIGDPGLPGQLTERDIPGGVEENIEPKSGETETDQFLLLYTYEYDLNSNYANNIQVTKAKKYQNNAIISDPYILEQLTNNYEDEIRKDIESMEYNNPL